MHRENARFWSRPRAANTIKSKTNKKPLQFYPWRATWRAFCVETTSKEKHISIICLKRRNKQSIQREADLFATRWTSTTFTHWTTHQVYRSHTTAPIKVTHTYSTDRELKPAPDFWRHNTFRSIDEFLFGLAATASRKHILETTVEYAPIIRFRHTSGTPDQPTPTHYTFSPLDYINRGGIRASTLGRT